jgi:hypothetical protein
MFIVLFAVMVKRMFGFILNGTRPVTDFAWYYGDVMYAIGMGGTILGFIYMLNETFGSADIAIDIGSIKEMLPIFAAGMATSFYTTLFGLGFGNILKNLAFFADSIYEKHTQSNDYVEYDDA